MDKLAFLLQIGWPSILCLIGGIGLVVLEMFLPGFGAPGICGGILLIVSVVLGAKDLFQAMVLILIIISILVIAFIFVMCSASRGRLAKSPFILRNTSRAEDGYISNEDMSYFIGKSGTAHSALRPAGVADFDGVRLDVVTEGDFMEAGTRVTVSRVEGARIVVRPESISGDK